MTRPLLEVADIVRSQGDRFMQHNFRCSTNKSRIAHAKPIAPTASAAPAASYKSPYRKCAGGMLFRSP